MAFTLNGKICVTSGEFFPDAQDKTNSRGNSWAKTNMMQITVVALYGDKSSDSPR
jgi:hypothetical protein